MKVKLLFLFLFTSLLFVQASKEGLLCDKKWEVKLVEINGKKEPMSQDSEKRFWMFFEKDGNLKVGSNEETQQATWKWSAQKDSVYITNYVGEKRGLKLLKLSKDSLVLSLIQENEKGTIYLETFQQSLEKDN